MATHARRRSLITIGLIISLLIIWQLGKAQAMTGQSNIVSMQQSRQGNVTPPGSIPSRKPLSIAVHPIPTWQRHLGIALSHPVPKALDIAVQAAKRHVLKQRHSSMAMRIGWAYMNIGKPVLGAKWFLRAIRWKPSNRPARYGFALAQQRLNHLERALRVLKHPWNKPTLALHRNILLTLGIEAYHCKAYEKARHYLTAARRQGVSAKDVNALLAWSAYHLGEYAEAARDFSTLYQTNPKVAYARAMIISLVKSGNMHELERLAGQDGAIGRLARKAEARQWLTQGVAAYHRKEYVQARRYLIAARNEGAAAKDVDPLLAWISYHTGDYAEAARDFSSLYQANPEAAYAKAMITSLNKSDDKTELERLAGQSGAVGRLARADEAQHWLDASEPLVAWAKDPDLAPVSGLQGPSVRAAFGIRGKSGENGTSRLMIRQAPDLTATWGYGSQQFQFSANRINLDNGGSAPASQLGSGLPGGAVRFPPVSNINAGWTIILRWLHEGKLDMNAEIGTTPLRAPTPTTFTGNLGIGHSGTSSGWYIGLTRRSVRDSILSYIGLHDPFSNQTWGRVLRTGVSAHGYHTLGSSWTLGGAFEADRLKGKSVHDNSQVGATLSLLYGLKVSHMRYLQLGPTVSWTHYTYNLYGFTWGQGGYFSPQKLLQIGLTLQFQTRPGLLVAAGHVNVGWQSMSVNSAPCFALSPPVAGGVCVGPVSTHSHGLASDVQLQSAWQFSPHWELTGSIALRTSPSYSDRALMVGLQYSFKARNTLFAVDIPTQNFESMY